MKGAEQEGEGESGKCGSYWGVAAEDTPRLISSPPQGAPQLARTRYRCFFLGAGCELSFAHFAVSLVINSAPGLLIFIISPGNCAHLRPYIVAIMWRLGNEAKSASKRHPSAYPPSSLFSTACSDLWPAIIIDCICRDLAKCDRVLCGVNWMTTEASPA